MSETLLAPAKLTLSLRMTGVREDGMHLLDAEMVTVSLADQLTVSEGPASVSISGKSSGVEVGEGNTVMQAMKLAGVEAQVEINKQITTQAGLGGGSADAAAIFRWAGFTDLDAAASIGADIPFCIKGGRARVTGIGEVLEPLPFEEQDFTLYTPGFGCSTVEVYKRWDELGSPTGHNGNDLEPAALAIYPELEEAKKKLWEAAGKEPRLAGSGSTWFVEGHVKGDAFVRCSAVEVA